MARDSVSLEAWSRHENVECKFHTSRARFRAQSSKARYERSRDSVRPTITHGLMGRDGTHWGNEWPGACERSSTLARSPNTINRRVRAESPPPPRCYPTLSHFIPFYKLVRSFGDRYLMYPRRMTCWAVSLRLEIGLLGEESWGRTAIARHFSSEAKPTGRGSQRPAFHVPCHTPPMKR